MVFGLDLEGMTRRHGGRAFRSAGAEAGAAVLAFSGARQDAVWSAGGQGAVCLRTASGSPTR